MIYTISHGIALPFTRIIQSIGCQLGSPIDWYLNIWQILDTPSRLFAMISQTILINNIIWIMNQIEMLIKCSHTYAMSLNWITIFPALFLYRKFCERFVTGVRGTSKLGSVRGSYLLFPNRSLPTCTGYLLSCLLSLIRLLFFFTIVIYGNMSIYQLKDSCLNDVLR